MASLCLSCALAEDGIAAPPRGSAVARPSAGAQSSVAEPPGGQVDADTLLGAFSRMPGLEASFVEEKRIGLLAKPLVSRGRLFFTHPGLLRRTVSSPRPSTVVVTPTAVHIQADGKRKTIDLSRLKDVGALVQSLVWILAGNRDALERAFRLQMSHGDGSWTLTLTPRAAPLTELLQQIRLAGRGLAVSRIHVTEVSGDESVTTIASANPDRRFSPQEKQRLFGVPSR